MLRISPIMVKITANTPTMSPTQLTMKTYLGPLLLSMSDLGFFYFIVQVHEPRTPILVFDVVLVVGTVDLHIESQTVWIQILFRNKRMENSPGSFVHWENDLLHRIQRFKSQLSGNNAVESVRFEAIAVRLKD